MLWKRSVIIRKGLLVNSLTCSAAFLFSFGQTAASASGSRFAGYVEGYLSWRTFVYTSCSYYLDLQKAVRYRQTDRYSRKPCSRGIRDSPVRRRSRVVMATAGREGGLNGTRRISALYSLQCTYEWEEWPLERRSRGEKREARSERERASPEIFGDQEGMQNTVRCSTGRVCRGRGMACCKSCIIQHLDLESYLAFHVLLSHYRITERSTHEQT